LAGASPKQAVENFLRPLQRALSCVTAAVIDRQGGYDLRVTYALTVNGGEPVRLARVNRPADIAIRIAQQYRIVHAEGDRGPLKVQTVAYMYTLEAADGREVFGYHWHPGSRSPFSFPHLHLEAGAMLGRPELLRAHLPTGRVSVEEFLRLVIDSFDVRARRRDWCAVLQQTQAAFSKWRTWA
jgi:hypothetical protein